jgi:hypothetical protein
MHLIGMKTSPQRGYPLISPRRPHVLPTMGAIPLLGEGPHRLPGARRKRLPAPAPVRRGGRGASGGSAPPSFTSRSLKAPPGRGREAPRDPDPGFVIDYSGGFIPPTAMWCGARSIQVSFAPTCELDADVGDDPAPTSR